MSVENTLRQLAAELVANVQEDAVAYRQEKRGLETRLAEIDAELELAKRAPQRLDTFELKLGDDLQCPCCWILHDRRTSLTPHEGPDTAYVFQCRACDFELFVPFESIRR